MQIDIDASTASAIFCYDIAAITHPDLQKGTLVGEPLILVFPKDEPPSRYHAGQKVKVRVTGGQSIGGILYHFVVPTALPVE